MAELFGSALYFSGGLIFVSFLLLPVVFLLCISLVYVVAEAICASGKNVGVLVWFRAARFARPGFFFADWCGTLEPEFEEAEAEYETEGSL